MPVAKYDNLPVGTTFHDWTITGPRTYIRRGKVRNIAYSCRCNCGTERVMSVGSLVTGESRSCGCRGARAFAAKLTKHGQARTRLYRIWIGIRQRCNNPNASEYVRYGGRGIHVVPEWDTDFASFRAWAEANGYSATLELDRINNDGDYGPANCRWVDHQTNARNRSDNVIVEAFGECKCIAEWGVDARCVISPITLRTRLARGWTPEQALTRPAYQRIDNINGSERFDSLGDRNRRK